MGTSINHALEQFSIVQKFLVCIDAFRDSLERARS